MRWLPANFARGFILLVSLSWKRNPHVSVI